MAGLAVVGLSVQTTMLSWSWSWSWVFVVEVKVKAVAGLAMVGLPVQETMLSWNWVVVEELAASAELSLSPSLNHRKCLPIFESMYIPYQPRLVLLWISPVAADEVFEGGGGVVFLPRLCVYGGGGCVATYKCLVLTARRSHQLPARVTWQRQLETWLG